MSGKATNWVLGAGAVLLFCGLCFVPAGFGPHKDESMRSAGAALFALGALVIAASLYLKAKALAAQVDQESRAGDSGASGKKQRRAVCDACHNAEPVIHCKVHQLHLCPDCLEQHYNFRTCAYVPTTRRYVGKAGKALAKARGA